MTHRADIARALHIADTALGHLRRGELDRARALRQPPMTINLAIADPLALPVLFVSNDFTTLAGSQIYANRWRADLTHRGFVTCTSNVLGLCARSREEVAKNVGAIVTWGDASMHMIRRFFGFTPSPPLVALVGNVPDASRDPGWLADLVMCSTEHAHRAMAATVPRRPSPEHGPAGFRLREFVLHPPIDPIYFTTPIPPLSERRAVVQVNLSKRPEIFDALARAMPDVPFIAVRGYGEQKIPKLPNVTELPQAPESPMLAYRQARVLIQPGIESYGLAAAEAGAMGVTACVNSTGNGAMETMADFGMSERDIGNVEVAKWIELVRWTLEKDRGSNRREALRERQRQELDAAADALARLMGR